MVYYMFNLYFYSFHLDCDDKNVVMKLDGKNDWDFNHISSNNFIIANVNTIFIQPEKIL